MLMRSAPSRHAAWWFCLCCFCCFAQWRLLPLLCRHEQIAGHNLRGGLAQGEGVPRRASGAPTRGPHEEIFFWGGVHPGNYSAALVDRHSLACLAHTGASCVLRCAGATLQVPFRHWQFDSWFYPKDGKVGPGGGGGAVTNWTAMPSVFPSGMAAIQDKLQVPMVMHNRQWSDHSDYIKNLYDDICHDLPSLLPPPCPPCPPQTSTSPSNRILLSQAHLSRQHIWVQASVQVV